MESGNGALYWTGRVVEADIDLCGEGRAADDLEHVGGGALLLQRFPQLFQRPSVFNRDDSLTREARNQRDLLVGDSRGHAYRSPGYSNVSRRNSLVIRGTSESAFEP
jgi:hypothetical protein